MTKDDHANGGASADVCPDEVKRCVLFADSDSQIFGMSGYARAFAARGWQVIFAIPEPRTIPQNALDRIAQFAIQQIALEDLPAALLAQNARASGVFATGSRMALFRHKFEKACNGLAPDDLRPAIFTGFNGLVFEKFEEGLAWRLGYDFVALNGPRDLRAAQAFLGHEDDSLITIGIGHDSAKVARVQSDRKSILFAEQVVVPSAPSERIYLAQQLIRIARSNPDWDVVVKPRIRPDEQTFHKATDHIQHLLQTDAEIPANLEISYAPIEEGFAKASIFATISSTALFAALRCGVPSIVVGDFGVKNGFGTHVFASSGIVHNLYDIESLDDVEPGQPNEGWIADLGFRDDRRDEFVEQIERGAFLAGRFKPQFYDAKSQQVLASMRNQADQLSDEVDAGQTAYREGRFGDAISHFRIAAGLSPASSKILRMKAEAEVGAGSIDDALVSLEMARSLKPGNKRIAKRIRLLRSPLRKFRWMANFSRYRM